MIKLEPALFNRLNNNVSRARKEIANIRNIGLTQKNVLLETIARNNDLSK